MRLALPAVAVIAALAVPASATAKCTSGVHKYGSGRARTFCGKASATIVIGQQTTKLKGGYCRVIKNGFTLNLGTILLGVDSPKRPDYFGVTVGRPAYSTPASKDGTYNGNAVVAFVIHHKRYALVRPTVVLTGNRSKGSFAGTLLSGGTATGKFSCG